jgi:hypothetical protein
VIVSTRDWGWSRDSQDGREELSLGYKPIIISTFHLKLKHPHKSSFLPKLALANRPVVDLARKKHRAADTARSAAQPIASQDLNMIPSS